MLAQRFYEWLQSGPTPDCDDVLAAGLATADGEWAQRIIRVLFERGHEASWAALLGGFDRLPDDVRTAMEAAPERIVNALARAMKSPEPAARVNALRVFDRYGRPRQLYLVADALRDAHAPAREAAAAVLRAHVAGFLNLESERNHAGASLDPVLASEIAEERQQIAVAVQEAARTFDRHHRVEALEAALWFSDALGAEFWLLLHNPRSRAGKVISERLIEWNRPEIAPFLLRALRDVAWRTQAANMLRRWTSLEHLLALLRCTHLLDHPEIRLQLSHVPAEPCLAAIQDKLSRIPEPLLPSLPRWVVTLGAEPAWRIRLLAEWCESRIEPLRRSAVYAIATIDHPDAATILRNISGVRTPLGRFAQWRLAGEESNLVPRVRAVSAAERAAPAPDPPVHSGASFPVLWQACRRASPRDRGPLLEAIREHADAWRRRLRELLRSPDARDRLMVLQIIGTAELAPQFRHDLEQLRTDPADSIRKLAQSVLASLREPAGTDDAPDNGREFDPDRLAGASDARREYKQLIRRLESDPEAAKDPAVVARVRAVLRRLRDQSDATVKPAEDRP